MKLVNIIIAATVPDDATLEEIDLITAHAQVQVEEPADDEGEDLEWTPIAVRSTYTVEEIPN